MPELPLVGDEFAGYRLRAVLGRGGMSVVYQAENPRLSNVIALKVLAPELASDDIFRTRFLQESRIAASLSHSNVIPIHDTGSSDGLLYIAMRYVSGTDLRQMIRKRGRLQPETAVFLLGQAARALDAAHARGLVHRDVKPANLLIERGSDDGDFDHLYVTDFGITKRGAARTGLTSTGQFPGTVDYVAPEQIRGLPVQGTADQYSLGCVLYECLTGRVPFEKDLDTAIIAAHVEENPTQPTLLRPDLTPAMDRVFDRVLAKQPGHRFRTCREFMAATMAALGDTAASPAPGSPRRPGTAGSSRHPADAEAGYPGEAGLGDYRSQAPGGFPPESVRGGYPGSMAAAETMPTAYPAESARGHPAEPAREGVKPTEAGTQPIFTPRSTKPPWEDTLSSRLRQAAGAPPDGAGAPGGGEPPGGPGPVPRRGRFRSRWLWLAVALALLAAAAGASYAALSH